MTPKRDRAGADAAGGSGAAAPEGQPFEAMMERLEALVERLEEGNLSLEESIRSFEEGVALVRKCTAVLSEAEQRVQRLTRDTSGAPKVEPEGEGDSDREGQNDELPF
jgi:exodeoxyribonuclease VII small subunit